jgi:hypothetical protein
MDNPASEFAGRQEIVTVRITWVFALLLMACSAWAAELGRMFYTPAQRATLDAARKQNIRTEVGNDNSEQPAAAAPAAPLPQNVSVNGVIRRSDGKSTIWLNNRIVSEHPTSGMNASVGKADNQVRLSVPESGRSVDLKVGQTVEIVSGAVGESYLRRRADKPEPKAAPGGENSGADVPKTTQSQPPEPVKSDRALQTPAQKRAARAAELNAADDARFNSGSEAK